MNQKVPEKSRLNGEETLNQSRIILVLQLTEGMHDGIEQNW
jgi:hypothetical protein